MDKLTEILEAQHVGLKSSIMNDRFVQRKKGQNSSACYPFFYGGTGVPSSTLKLNPHDLEKLNRVVAFLD
ncbi:MULTISPECIES: hypothetical protein [unclassified Paenibacillus]|uniref:hypothetical protein n=1 Tax=unclassified Paenibacillus TaxID=185978 RepID=UPI0030F6C468